MKYSYEDTVGSLDEKLVVENTEKAIESALADTPCIFGKRPRDWLSRDLLIGSSLADRRNWMLRKLLGDKTGFLSLGLSPAMQKHESLIKQGRAFDYLHALHVLNMRDACSEGSHQKWSTRRILICPTSLWGIAPPNEVISRFRICRRGWVCPYCYSRAAVDCYEKLSKRLTPENCAFLALISTTHDVVIGDEKEVNVATKNIRKDLLKLARFIGGCGGLWSVQLGPLQTQRTIWTGGQIEYATENAMSLRVAVLLQIPKTHEAIDRLTSFTLCGARPATGLKAGKTENIKIDLLLFHDPKTLRAALRAALVAAGPMGTSRQQITNNAHGLFYWPPVWLCSPDQWLVRFTALANHKSFSPWGSFRNAPPVNSSPPIVAHTPVCSPTQAEVAKARREQLFAELSPIIRCRNETAERPLGRRALRDFLKAEGHNVSERDIRWFLERLKFYF